MYHDAQSSECQIEVQSCVRPSALPILPAFFLSMYSRYFDDKLYRVSRINILCKSNLDS